MRKHPLLGYSRLHKRVDIVAPYGTPIRAAIDGTVKFAGWHGGHGKYVLISQGRDLMTGYAHMSQILVRPGAAVSAGQVIGYVGSTGLSTGPHLHYEVYRNGTAINPASLRFTSVAQLTGGELVRFQAALAGLASARRHGSAGPTRPLVQPQSATAGWTEAARPR